jgi:CRISPR-associated endonuclease/helicase Cas3
MTEFPSLLAKKPKNPEQPCYEETLLGHTERVCKFAGLMADMMVSRLQVNARVGENESDAWKLAVTAGAWIHDWGKANDHFQRMLREANVRQGVRHETLTLMLATELAEWLAPLWDRLPNWAKCAALFSATGHHLKFPDPLQDSRGGTEVTVLGDHTDFTAVLQLKAECFGLSPLPQLKRRTYSLLHRGYLRKTLVSLRRELDFDFSETEKLLIAAAKSTIMAADLAGSALPSKNSDPVKWVQDRLGRTLTARQLQGVVEAKLKGNTPREFQIEVSETSNRTTLVEAGCGSGKTAAAYLWASRHAEGKRLFFCYPTTGTATEGFAGYLSDPDFDAILVHSRADADYRLLENMPEMGHEENELRQAGLEALETWPVPAVVCTAHTVLGLLENVRRGIYAFPSILQSVFVFDEIHAFSDRLFSYLLRFLEAFPDASIVSTRFQTV